jgi:2-polyprenyl-3-methyl-5-hydroxy-6-metoxy-1,4-benzoquinol methylase
VALDEHYTNTALTAVYDRFNPWSADNEFYLALAGDAPIDLLDLGCGTGLLCDAYAARGHRVTGVDPAAAMLSVAQQRQHALQIRWVQSTAQQYRTEQRFDLIIMTGHVFQVLLSDADVQAAFTTVRQLLKPAGRFVFESRNPAIDWAAAWNGSDQLTHQGAVLRQTITVIARSAERLTFTMQYDLPRETPLVRSELRFLSRAAIEERLESAGLQAESVFGDWQSAPFDPAASHEMIFTVRRSPE